MRLSCLTAVVVAIGLFASACSRPGEKRCTEVCEHYLDLYLADKYDQKLAEVNDEEQRAALTAEKEAEYKERRENEELGFQACVNRCNRRSRGMVSDCVMKAETLAAAKACDAEESCQIATRPGRNSLGVVVVMLVAMGLVFGLRRRRYPS